MATQFDRTENLIGAEAVEKLKRSAVIVFGIGGVGGYVCEALVRAGIGRIDIVDKDTVDITNLNRQIIATHKTIGRPKVEVMRERMLSINPALKCDTYELFYAPEEAAKFDFRRYDYVVDCVDNVTAKIDIIWRAKEAGVQIISSMGTANKLDPTRFEIKDIEKTSVCPLARVVRRELKKRKIRGVNVLFSTEEPIKSAADRSFEAAEKTVPGTAPPAATDEEAPGAAGLTRTAPPATISFVPSCAGLIIAGKVITDLYK